MPQLENGTLGACIQSFAFRNRGGNHREKLIARHRIRSAVERRIPEAGPVFCQSWPGYYYENQQYMCLAVAAREEIFRAIPERLGTRYKEPEGISQPTDHIKRKADRKRIFDLSA